jgi:hypothetical protein
MVPKLVVDGVPRFVCNNFPDILVVVGRVGSLDRRACRPAVEDRFSAAIAGSCERVYAAVCAEPVEPEHEIRAPATV